MKPRLLASLATVVILVLSGCGGGGSTKADINTINLSDFKIATGATTFKPGNYTFTIKNNGPNHHELLVFSTTLDPTAFPTESNGDMQEEGTGVTKVSDGDNIDAGKSQSRTVDLTQPGTYVFVCNLTGHFKAGMFTKITVAP